MKNIIHTLILLLFVSQSCSAQGLEPIKANEKIKGITVVGSDQPYEGDPISEIKNIHGEWIALVPYGFTRKGEPAVRYGATWQWWGETPEGIIKNIQLAKSNNLKIMLKPQIYIPHGWIGEMDYTKESDWLEWEKSYENFMMDWVNLCINHEVDMICIGTEIRESVKKRVPFWRKLIAKIRKIYDGKLVYSSNWDDYDDVSFWDQLDYIGISSYFPLSEEKTPSVKSLKNKWKPIISKLKKYSQKKRKPILFTEFGYLTIDGCAGKTWELEKKVKSIPINQQAQKNAIQALFESFWQMDFWAGGFLWKWFPENMGHEGYFDRDYTPQGKESEKFLEQWFSTN